MNVMEKLCYISRSDEALEIRGRLGRPLTEDELMVLLVAQQIEDWASAVVNKIEEVM